MAENNTGTANKTWVNRWTFMLAAAGSAIGLGNIWKFPYIAGEYGGGAFVLVYLLCITIMGVPLLMAETLIGRTTRLSPLNGIKKLISDASITKAWQAIAWMGMLCGFLILSFYSVIAGWSLSYAWDVLNGVFTGMNADQVGDEFSALVSSAPRQIIWHTTFMLLTLLITSRGIHKGLEKGLQVMMPMLFFLLLIMLGYSVVETGQFMRGASFMFSVDFTKLNQDALLAALGQAFFTLSLGMCALMAYGAYMPAKNSIGKTAFQVATLDTAMAILSGLVVFPIVFAYGLEPSAGPGLLFVSLTAAFANMPMGDLFGFLFFALVGIAALSSAISLVEPTVAWLTERTGMSRKMATVVLCSLVWVVGLGTVFSFTDNFGAALLGSNFFDAIDFLTNSILMPLGGVLIAIFAGWKIKQSVVMAELSLNKGMFTIWRVVVGILVPICVTAVLITTVF
ncbi:MAG: sodium-dependent transporter [Endozoicomonas sp. (ex Botrylloides leachii)]|nr:sodium-dependent transporter [Endozoicomonas sp. (ex Botrylloides leachii)]